MSVPFEVVAGPADVWVAPALTADVVISSAPGGSWVKIGAVGNKDYTEDGVTWSYEEDVNDIYSDGATGAIKAFRTRERVAIAFTLMDATAESYQRALNEAAITALAGPPAEKTLALLQGGAVSLRALLIRGASMSPYADSANPTQLYVPLCYQKGNITTKYSKGTPIGLALNFFALQDATLGFGKLHIPTA